MMKVLKQEIIFLTMGLLDRMCFSEYQVFFVLESATLPDFLQTDTQSIY